MMSEPDRDLLQDLKNRADRLRAEAADLQRRVHVVEEQLKRDEGTQGQATAPAASATPTVVPSQVQAVPPPLPVTPQPAPASPADPIRRSVSVQPPATPLKMVSPDRAKAAEQPRPTEPTSKLVAAQEATEPSPMEVSGQRSFEMQLGTVWLVRVGIVMLLTALVFFGKFAYTNFIGKLGPLGKVVLMYLAGGALLGLGAWFQRGRETLRNYGQVLFAGGLASVYFTTYAAHHVERLRVISSPVVDGILLLAWAGFMVYLADRRKSELLAIFAVGLAFYASAITRAGSFTLFSNLVLTSATLVFLVRNRWTALPQIGLVAAYVSYAFWRFYAAGPWDWQGPNGSVWPGASFLLGYWAIFTAGVFLTRKASLDPRARIGILTLNNGAFFTLFLLTMWQFDWGDRGIFCLVYGGVLLGIALLAQRVLEEERWVGLSYLLQGLTLVTVGLIARYSGLQLGLLLTAESVILLTTSHALSLTSLRHCAHAVAVLAFGFTLIGLGRSTPSSLVLGLGVGAMFTFEAWWTGARKESSEADSKLRGAPAGYSLLALGVWLATIVGEISNPWQWPVLALAGLAITGSVYLIRVPELSLLSQGFVLLAQFAWCANKLSATTELPAWTGLTLLAISLTLTHWWQHQKVLRIPTRFGRVWEAIYALAAMVLLLLWLKPQMQEVTWLSISAMLAVGMAGYGLASRSVALGVTGQIFAVAAVIQFLAALTWEDPPTASALVPILALSVLATGARWWLRQSESAQESANREVNVAAAVYGWTAYAMAILWVWEHIPTREHAWVFALSGGALWAWAGWRQQPQTFMASAALSVLSLCFFVVPSDGGETLYALNLLVPSMLAGQQRLARRFPTAFKMVEPSHTVLMVAAALGFSLYLTRWIQQDGGGSSLTAAWAVLAFVFFVAGFLLRERAYRWTGLGVLGLALARVVLVDVWKLDALARTVSFFALGVVLLALGFFYNRFQDRIRQWL